MTITPEELLDNMKKNKGSGSCPHCGSFMLEGSTVPIAGRNYEKWWCCDCGITCESDFDNGVEIESDTIPNSVKIIELKEFFTLESLVFVFSDQTVEGLKQQALDNDIELVDGKVRTKDIYEFRKVFDPSGC